MTLCRSVLEHGAEGAFGHRHVDAGSGVEQAAPVDLDPAFARRHQAGDGVQHGRLAGPGMAGQCDHPGIVMDADVAAEPAASARAAFDAKRSEKSGVGKEVVSTCRYGWWP